MSEEKSPIPKTGDEEIDSLYNMVFSQKDDILDKYHYQVYNGLIDSIAEYQKNKEREKKREFQFGSNPLEYYDVSKKEGNNLSNIKDYYDIDKAKTSNIDRATQYRMFYPQVVESLKKGNIISLPETLDVGAYYNGVAKDALQIDKTGRTRDIDVEALSSNVNDRYRKSVGERLNFLINNTKADDLYGQFNVKNQDKYQNKMKSDLELVFDHVGKVVAKVTGKKVVEDPSAETNAANAYNDLLSNAAGGGRKLGKDMYFDTEGNEVTPGEYKMATDEKITGTDAYKYGVDLAKKRGSNSGNQYFIDNAVKNDKKLNDYYTAKQGYYDQLVKEGEKVITIGEERVPNAVRAAKIERQNNNGAISYSVGNNQIGSSLNYDQMQPGLRDYVNKYDWMQKVLGGNPTDEMGKGWMPY